MHYENVKFDKVSKDSEMTTIKIYCKNITPFWDKFVYIYKKNKKNNKKILNKLK